MDQRINADWGDESKFGEVSINQYLPAEVRIIGSIIMDSLLW
jgi:hypothetical protein